MRIKGEGKRTLTRRRGSRVERRARMWGTEAGVGSVAAAEGRANYGRRRGKPLNSLT